MSAICKQVKSLEAFSGYLRSFASHQNKLDLQDSLVKSKIFQEHEGLWMRTKEFQKTLHTTQSSLEGFEPRIYMETLVGLKSLEDSPLGKSGSAIFKLFKTVDPRSMQAILQTADKKLNQFEILLEPNTEQLDICSLTLLQTLLTTLDKLISLRKTLKTDVDNESDHEFTKTTFSLYSDLDTLEQKLKDAIKSSLKNIGNILLGYETTPDLIKRFKAIIFNKLIKPLTNSTDISISTLANLSLNQK